MKTFNVIWDLDGQDIDLPTTFSLPDGVEYEDVADLLSDTYGWCVNSLEEV